jgi:hypothetical protein
MRRSADLLLRVYRSNDFLPAWLLANRLSSPGTPGAFFCSLFWRVESHSKRSGGYRRFCLRGATAFTDHGYLMAMARFRCGSCDRRHKVTPSNNPLFFLRRVNRPEKNVARRTP